MSRIIIDADVLCGKPVIAGTRLSVEWVVGLLAQGWSIPQVLDQYPGIERVDVIACLEHT
jgi:uncharacterized protein (DUF433 family)